jgi:hypothetical protein
LVSAATAIALVWFLPNLSSVVAQSSTVDSTTSSSSSSSSSSTSSTSSTTTPTTPTTLAPINSILLQLGATTAAVGDPVGGSGQGVPFSTISLTFNSAPVSLGNVTADSNGNFVFVFNVPFSADPGLHTVVARGPNGEQGSATLTVTPPLGAQGTGYGYPPVLPLIPAAPIAPALPVVQTAPTSSGPAFTGVNVGGLLLLAGAALALGGMAFTFGRLEPAIVLPRRRRLQWAHRRRR